MKSDNTTKAVFAVICSGYATKDQSFYKTLSTLILNDFFELMGDQSISQVEIERPHMKQVLHDVAFLMDANLIEHRHAKVILHEAWGTDQYAWDIGWYLSDSQLLEEADNSAVSDAINNLVESDEKCAKAIEDIRNGRVKAAGFLVGQVMRALGGKADPKEVREEILNYSA